MLSINVNMEINIYIEVLSLEKICSFILKKYQRCARFPNSSAYRGSRSLVAIASACVKSARGSRLVIILVSTILSKTKTVWLIYFRCDKMYLSD